MLHMTCKSIPLASGQAMWKLDWYCRAAAAEIDIHPQNIAIITTIGTLLEEGIIHSVWSPSLDILGHS